MLFAGVVSAQNSGVRVEEQHIPTYSFGDPDPIPILYRDAESYPYFRFDDFSLTRSEEPWTVVHLENAHIDVTVLPEVGGKVWGGVEKSTGHEFIYENEVLKFRDIAVRGPWTSGGIEFNFSSYGHAPSVSTPVDYIVETDEDGNESVVLGATAWTSRTKWRVRLSVPEDKAYLQIDNLWVNPTPLNGLWYHWLNAAAVARNDLQFFFPGTHYIGHGGDAHPWPIDDEGRDLSYYRNNDFGGSKSYHVLGKYTDYYGGYWHDLGFGFGHWAPYPDAPGKKIWIWSHSRSGGIWEDLLTDTDGQYVEVQAGWKFNQTQGMTQTPFAQTFFPPFAADQWTEIYFPVKEIGGMVDASPYAVMNVSREGRRLEIAVNALQRISDSLKVEVGGRPLFGGRLDLGPMDVARRTVELPNEDGRVVVSLLGAELFYDSAEGEGDLERPLRRTLQPEEGSAAALFREAEELNIVRQYGPALETYLKVLEREPTHTDALGRVAELYFRRAEYGTSLEYASRALEINTYDPYANLVYGIAQRRLGDLVNAKEALGWAARSPEFQSGAYAEVADVLLQQGEFEEAEEFARRALRANDLNLNAYEVLAVSLRKQGVEDEAEEVLATLLDIDPLSHFARFEQHLLRPSAETLQAFTSMIRSEMPDETYLELAVRYAGAGLTDEAIRVLEAAPEDPIVSYWLAYLHRDRSASESRGYLDRAVDASPHLVFPFRQETIPILEWALEEDDAWQTKYYLGTLLWSIGRPQEAAELYEQAGDAPDYAPFHLVRGYLRRELGGKAAADAAAAFRRAVEVDEDQWRARLALARSYNEQGERAAALDVSREAYERFPDNYYIGLEHVATLLDEGEYAESARILEDLTVLPSEGARTGHVLFERAYIGLAVESLNDGEYERAAEQLQRARQWPEHLGVGQPYGSDERLEDYLLAVAYARLGREEDACARLRMVVDHTEDHPGDRGLGAYVGALALRHLGRADEGRELLERWVEAGSRDNRMATWALASYTGDQETAREIASAFEDPMAPYGQVRHYLESQAGEGSCCACR